MIETGVLIGFEGEPLFWLEPPGRSATSIPDTRELWNRIWEHRATLQGFAHSHPGSGTPWPSHEDLTTFAAVESALGRRLVWWITSRSALAHVFWQGPKPHDYSVMAQESRPSWLLELRARTDYEGKNLWKIS